METNTEADEVGTGAGGVAGAPSRTQARPGAAPGTTPADPIRARSRTLRIGLGTGKIICFPVVDPLPDISMHVKKAPGVGGKLADIHGLLGIIAIISTAVPVIISTGGVYIIAPRVCRGRSGSAGILPLRLRG
ncbi:hypothetical protein OAQ34_05800 [Opitutales bacterium]|nr:hypothetical protein [Opitutales bacterium]